MVRTIPLNGNPNGQVFGTIGSLIEMSDGLKYVKITGNSLNDGWEPYNVAPTPTPTPTSTPTPTPTPTATPTATPTPTPTPTVTPTGAPTYTPTPTPTTIPSRAFNISPAVGGKSVWDLNTDGPFTVSGYGIWIISPFASSFNMSVDVNGSAGGKGGDTIWKPAGLGSRGTRYTGSFYLDATYKLITGNVGGNAPSNGFPAGGSGGLGYYSGGKGAVGARAESNSTGGGGGGGASVILSNSDILQIGVGGGGGGNGASYDSIGAAGVWQDTLFVESDGTSGPQDPNTYAYGPGFGGGGGGGGGIGIFNALGGSSGGGVYETENQISLATGNGYITLS
jgi:hypothetical protein